MITRFLSFADEMGRRIINGIVEDDTQCEYDPNKTFAISDDKSFVNKDNNNIILNKGKQGYMVFRGTPERYVDVNIYNGEVKIALTTNISHAACYSEAFFEAILNYTNYFNCEDEVEFVFSGFKRGNQGLDDAYESLFKRAADASYVKINKNGKSYFLCRREDQTYFLSEDFGSASKVARNEIRRVLLINKFVDEDTDRHDLSYSPLKALSYNESFIYAGRNPFMITFVEGQLDIKLNPEIPLESRLIKNEDVFLALKDVSYLIGKEKSQKSYYLEVNKKYVYQNGDLSYRIVENPYEASLINDYDIEIIKAGLKVYSQEFDVIRKNKNYFLYYFGNVYTLSDKALPNYDNGRMVDVKEYNDYVSTFKESFNNSNRKNGNILIHNDKYLNLEVKDKNSFALLLSDSSYNASLFTKDEVKALSNLLKWDFKVREINNLILNDLTQYNIYPAKTFSILDNYKGIMNDITSKKTTIVPYNYPSEIKTETEKGSLEYLRRFYISDILDYKDMFEKTLNDNVKNILIIAPKLNLELEALSLATDKDVNVTVLNENKFGYLPKIFLKSNIHYNALYRLKLQNLPGSFITQYDMVVFGKAFDEMPELFKETMDSILSTDKDMIFLNTKTCNFEKTGHDTFFEYFKTILPLKRKYFTYENTLVNEVNDLDNVFKSYLSKIHAAPVFDTVYLDNKHSYHSIVVKNGNKVKDYYSK